MHTPTHYHALLCTCEIIIFRNNYDCIFIVQNCFNIVKSRVKEADVDGEIQDACDSATNLEVAENLQGEY